MCSYLCKSPQKPEEEITFPGASIIGSCELHNRGTWILPWGLCKKKFIFLSAEPSLYPPVNHTLSLAWNQS